MAQDWFNRLEQAANQAADIPVIWQASASPDVPRLMILPRAGRVIACQMPGVMENLFYHHPQLEDPARAAEVLAAASGMPGGDRLWISPESAYRWKNLPQARRDLAGHAFTPREMDPADHHVRVHEPGRLQLVTAMTLHDDRHDQSLSLRVSREFTLIDPPAGIASGLACMSFAITHELTVLEAGASSQAGVWDLLQVPPTGTLICPTTTHAGQLRSYYEPFGPERVRVGDRAVRFLIDSRKCVKMGLKPEHTTGRMGYHRRVGEVNTRIVRIFHPQPGRPYVDMPVDEILAGARTGGDALQAYNHDGSGGLSFGEMEYHDPAVLGSQSSRTVTGSCVTHVLAGFAQQIEQASQLLLGVGIEG